MNLSNLFEIQRKLDAEIEEKHPTTAGEDRLAKRILALQVELGECANEWRGFKFWSNDQEPRNRLRTTQGATKDNVIELFCSSCGDTTTKDHDWFNKILKGDSHTCLHCGEPEVNFMTEKNPLLEEYVDCLHFILSIGLGRKSKTELESQFHFTSNDIKTHKYDNITVQFIWLTNTVSRIFAFGTDEYDIAVLEFLGLGEMLGFTWEQIEQAYLSKNKTNWERQANGY